MVCEIDPQPSIGRKIRQGMDPRIQIFYRQYLQQVDFTKLSFPPGGVLLEPMVQAQIFDAFFCDTGNSMYPSAETASRVYLPLSSYQKRVLKEIITRIEGAIIDHDEDEVSNDLMEKMASLSLVPANLTTPIDTAQLTSVLTYTLPPNTDTFDFWRAVHENTSIAQHIFMEESPNLLAADGTTGQRTWEASLHLATYLLATEPHRVRDSDKEGKPLVRGRSVLELGAGAGLLSIICAGPLKAAHVLATDGDENVRQRIEKNISLNTHLAHHHQPPPTDLNPTCSKPPNTTTALPQNISLPIKTKTLSWGNNGPPSLSLSSHHHPQQNTNNLSSTLTPQSYNTILGADITYNLESLDPLASTLNSLSDLYPDADILLASTLRNKDTFDAFVDACGREGRQLHVEDVAVEGFECPRFEEQRALFHFHCCGSGGESSTSSSSSGGIRIVKIKKKR